MECAHCGNLVTGPYCSNCGQKMDNKTIDSIPIQNRNWLEETNYGAIINYSEVQDLIRIHAEGARSRLDVSKFMKLVDLIQQQLSGFSGEGIIKFFKKSGLGTGKSFETILTIPLSKAIVKVYCALAKNGYPLKETQNSKDGLIIIAELPADIRIHGGTIRILIEKNDSNSRIEVKVRVEGQLIDWGKSKSVIKKIVADIEMIQLN